MPDGDRYGVGRSSPEVTNMRRPEKLALCGSSPNPESAVESPKYDHGVSCVGLLSAATPTSHSIFPGRDLDNSCRRLSVRDGHKETLKYIFWTCPVAQ